MGQRASCRHVALLGASLRGLAEDGRHWKTNGAVWMVLLLSLCFKHRNNLERGGMIFDSFWVWDPIIQACSVVAPVVVASSDADRAWELQKLLQAWLLCILLHGFLSFLPPTPPFKLEAKSTRKGPSRKSSLGKVL